MRTGTANITPAKHLQQASRHLKVTSGQNAYQFSKSGPRTHRPSGTRALVVQPAPELSVLARAAQMAGDSHSSPEQLKEQLDTLDQLLEEAERVRKEVTEQLRQLQPEPGTPSTEPYNGPERRQWPEARRPTRSR